MGRHKQRYRKQQITEWLDPLGAPFPSQYGTVTAMEWLDRELERLADGGVDANIVSRKGRVCLVLGAGR